MFAITWLWFGVKCSFSKSNKRSILMTLRWLYGAYHPTQHLTNTPVEQTSSFKRWRMIIVCCHIQLNMPQRCPSPCLLVPLSCALIDEPCQDSPTETNTFQPHCSLPVPWPIPLFLDQYVLMDSHSRDGYCVHCHYGTGSVRGQLALHGFDSFLCLWLHSRTLLSVWLRVIFQRFLRWAAPSVLIRKRNGIGVG